MPPTPPLPEEQIFQAARRIESPEARSDYLDHACAEDPQLRERVDALLAALASSESFLELPASGVADERPTVYQTISERPGDTLGPYKLLQQIGEGGMGVVYMAEQTEPIERRVAIKIIKPGMDTRQVIARFEAERQALAMMDHPNIAKVIDACSTETGRPYFVMELVKGVPITKYCDQHRLTPSERLELFIPVCQAIQHAHQKGIIHRDIKPSNVLIARYDDRAVPKVIDFGVAKAIDHRLTERTMFTEFGQVLGTFEYMSPEQAQFNQLDVDARTDVYSLGVLLYELLAGETPFDQARLRSAAFDELLQIIREEDPPRPSVRLSSSESLPSIAANRATEPRKLSAAIDGDLDWIVMTALEKDRTRRYETPNALADDVARHLNHEPVVACPPSAGYRFRKFAQRNKARLTTWVIAIVALLGVTAVYMHQDAMTRRAEQLAESRQGQLEEVESRLRDNDWPPSVSTLVKVARVYQDDEQFDDAEATYRKALDLVIQKSGRDSTSAAAVMDRFATQLTAQRKSVEAESLLRKAIAIYENAGEEREYELILSLHHLGQAIRQHDKFSEAADAFRTALAIEKIMQSKQRAQPAFTFYTHRELAEVYCLQGRFADAEAHFGEAIRISREHSFRTEIVPWLRVRVKHVSLAQGGPDAESRVQDWAAEASPGAVGSLAWLLATCENPEMRHTPLAVQLANMAVERDPAEGHNWNVLAAARLREGNFEESISAVQTSMRLRDGGDSLNWFLLSMALWHLGNETEAQLWYDRAIEWMSEHKPHNNKLRQLRSEAAELLGIDLTELSASQKVDSLPTTND